MTIRVWWSLFAGVILVAHHVGAGASSALLRQALELLRVVCYLLYNFQILIFQEAGEVCKLCCSRFLEISLCSIYREVTVPRLLPVEAAGFVLVGATPIFIELLTLILL